MQQILRTIVLSSMVVLLAVPAPVMATEGPSLAEQVVGGEQAESIGSAEEVPATVQAPSPLLPEAESLATTVTSSDLVAPPAPTTVAPAEDSAVINALPSPSEQPVTTAPEPLPYADVVLGPVRAEADVIISATRVHERLERLELYNTANAPVDLSRYAVHQTVLLADDTEYECSLQLDGYLLPKQYVTYSLQATHGTDYSPPEYVHVFSERCHEAAVGVVSVEVFVSDSRVERLYEQVRPTIEPGDWVRKGVTTADSNRSGVLRTNFAAPAAHVFRSSELYVPPEDSSLMIQEVLITPALCAPQATDVTCRRYVKVINTSEQPVDLATLRLRSGDPSRNATSANTTYLGGVVAPGERYVISRDAAGGSVYLAGAEGTVWFEDVHGIMQYDSPMTPYAGADRVANKARSWAYDSETDSWRWGVPSPDGVNRFPDESLGMGSASSGGLKPCRDDQYRSEETNRCRSIAATSSTLKPCKEGQYRSEETNRCRSIASAASAAKPCADDQFRNPATGRCKKIASADELADCGEGRERNPETNRCRNVALASIPDAAFRAEPIKQGAEVFVGWWALGGVLLLALGYAGWEWRREVAALALRVQHFVRRQK